MLTPLRRKSMYTELHGITGNNMYPNLDEEFSMDNTDIKWWGQAEPKLGDETEL